MKQRILHTAMATAMAAAALTITACAEHDTVTNPTTEKPTATVQKITVSLDDAADTRAVNPATGKKTFAEGDQIGVYYLRENGRTIYYAQSVALGVDNISNGGKSATFSVGLESNRKENGFVFYVYPAGMALTASMNPSDLNDASTAHSNLIGWTFLYGQSGTINDIGTGSLNEHDLATFYGQLNGSDLPTTAKLENQLAILELTVVDGTGADVTATLTELEATIGSTTYYVEGADTDGKIYMAVRPISTATDIVFTATNDNGTPTTDDDVVYKKTVKDVTLDRNTITPVTLTAYTRTVDLSSAATGTTITLADGDCLTGTLDGEMQKVKVQIAPGATVTLDRVTINGADHGTTECLWAGITCLGDATILLAGSNMVKNFNRNYPAIFVPSGKTLTIYGTGSLTASNTCNDGTGFGAAIGGGYDMDCGNIAITGGTVTATGGDGSAAIGGGSGASCGSITIDGAKVTATAEGFGGAGIGSGDVGSSGASCGDITISGTANVTATGGDGAAGIGSGIYNINFCGSISISGACTVNATGGNNGAGIGTGQNAKCGDISITGGTVTAQGGDNAAGIGCGEGRYGNKSVCGNISINTIEESDDFDKITAIRGQGAYLPIGHSSGNPDNNSCGNITFGENMVYTYVEEEVYIAGYGASGGGFNFLVTTTDFGDPEEDYMGNTWVLTPAPSE